MPFSNTEAYQILSCAKTASVLDGSFAELGVYKGASARLICEVKGEKKLFLFDTFEGLPNPSVFDSPVLKGKQYTGGLDYVKQEIVSYKNVFLIKGLFPATAKEAENETFAFVHLDPDIYESVMAGLNFFYPRMTQGGIILSHDYPSLPGVKKAFDEFFSGKPERVIDLSTDQALVVKL